MPFANDPQGAMKRQMLVQQLMAPKRESDSRSLDVGALTEPLFGAYMQTRGNPNMGGAVNRASQGNPHAALTNLPMGGAVNAASQGVPGQLPQQGGLAKLMQMFGGS